MLVSGAAFEEIEREYTELLKADPGSLKRPDQLRGLSPWTDTDGRAARRDRRPIESRVGAIVAPAMDSRGAWVEEGAIGKANRLVSVLAGRDLVVTLGGKTLPLKENDTLEVFAGPEPGGIVRVSHVCGERRCPERATWRLSAVLR